MRVARDALNTVDGVQIALSALLVKGQERGRFEGKHGKGRHERIGQSNLRIGRAMIWDMVKAAVHQPKECIGGQMLTDVRHKDGHGKPRHENSQWFKARGIFASKFTKGQCSSHGEHWPWRRGGNCWLRLQSWAAVPLRLPVRCAFQVDAPCFPKCWQWR